MPAVCFSSLNTYAPELIASSSYETRVEEDCISQLEQILALLEEMGSPPHPTVAQLKALCVDISALNQISARLAASPLAADQTMAQEIQNILTAPFGSYTLLSAAESYPTDPSASAMVATFNALINSGSFPTLVSLLQNWIQDPPWSFSVKNIH